ncbi:MAG: glycoside hydrolase [Lachnospiraceae bacterium]|nr:glycoside hydrolase [Lachnospiraceae bacterium]
MRNKKRVLALLLAGVLAFGGLPITASAANNVKDGVRPANGTTVSQPFPEKLFLGEHNSTNGYTRFRIPALTTAADGTLVAATDIRWDKCGDGGGIDTVVSRSGDGGENWSYTVANYLGDNGNKFNNYSSAFIDASLVTKGDAIYMVCDLYPAAIGLNSAAYAPKTGS